MHQQVYLMLPPVGYPFIPSHTPKPTFGSIYPLMIQSNYDRYETAKKAHPEEHLLRPYTTRIFREKPVIMALMNVIGQKPTDIHILGASDGSEVYAYAIALKEAFGDYAKKNMKIIALEREPFLYEMARSGYLVLADQERIDANNTTIYPKHPLAGAGWDRYLKPSGPPPNFEQLCRRYPKLAQITRDTVSNASIGNGLNWYRVDQTNFPRIEFKQGDMTGYVRNAAKGKGRQQVYVLANSWSYVHEEKGEGAFFKVIHDIVKDNERKNQVFVTTGTAEAFKLQQDAIDILQKMTMQPMSAAELIRYGVNPEDANEISVTGPGYVNSYIWRIDPFLPGQR